MRTSLTAAATALTAAASLLSFTTLVQAQPGCAAVEVQNLRPAQGPLMLAAYTDAATFRKTAAAQMQVAVTGETMQLHVCGLAGSSVALTLFQDLNSNTKLDVNPFGVPTEPWGASGKVNAMAGPTWDSAQVALDTNPIVVRMSK